MKLGFVLLAALALLCGCAEKMSDIQPTSACAEAFDCTVEQKDVGCGGLREDAPDHQWCVETIRNEAGEVIAGFHTDCRGTTKSCLVVEINGNIRTEWWDSSCGGGKERTQCRVTEYDANGRAVHTYNDLYCDGGSLVSFCAWNSYDESGNLLTRHNGVSCDEKPSNCHRWEYDAAGRVLLDGTDINCDGTFDQECERRIYDGDVQVGGEFSHLCDDVFSVSYKHVRDESGAITMTIHTDRVFPQDFNCEFFERDEHGGAVFEHKESNCDGITSACVTRTFDEEGRVTSFAQDNDCDEVPDLTCKAWAYYPR